MEFKGTKGKWSIEQDKEFTTLHNIWSDEESILKNGTLIARTCYAIRSEANALLISKAPEMLEFINKYKGYLRLEDQIKANTLIKEATELKTDPR